jgi:uncharacterized membrane protein YeaQ/YmgE (transglycosylase-associated protein family)
MKTLFMGIISRSKLQRMFAITLGAAVCVFGMSSFAQTAAAPDQLGGTNLAGATNQARQFIQETGQAAVNHVQTLWQRIDEKRLKNRTPDQIVAWIIMGCLAGGLLYRFGKKNQFTSILFGLIGAFIGGILANVTQLNLGLGPVLITYEDLLFTLAGGVLMILIVRWSSIMKLIKPKAP